MILMFCWLNLKWNFAVVQSLTHVWFFPTPWTAAHQAFLSFIISRNLLNFMSIESVMLSNDLMLCCSLLLLPSIFPSIRVFSNELTLRIRWPNYWSFSVSSSPSDEYSGFISFRIDQFDLLAVQEALKSVLQLHSLKTSILQHSAFFMVQLSHMYMTTWKTIAWLWIFVGRVMSLLFIMLSHLVIAFLPRSKIFNFIAVVTVCSGFGAQENEVCHCFHFFSFSLPWSDGTRFHDFSFFNVEF